MIGLGTSSTLGIGLVIDLRDQFTAKANMISKSLSGLHANANTALRNSMTSMVGVGAGMSAIGVGIMKGMQVATKEAMGFQKVMINIKALGEMSETDMLGLGKLAKSLGPKYGLDPTKVAQGMEDLVKAGLKANEIPSVLEAILRTSIGASEALDGEGGVAARMTDILMAWGFQANQADHVGDVMAKAAIESTTSFGQLSESMKYSQSTLRELNFTFEESVAMMAVLGNSGIKASMAGTALNNAWKELTIGVGGGSKKKNNALHAMGLSPRDLMNAEGGLKRPIQLLSMIKKGVQGMGDVQKYNVLQDLFGVRGERGISPLVKFLMKGPSDKWMGKSFEDMVKSLTSESAGSNLRIFEEKTKGAAFQAERLKATWSNFKIAIGQAIIPLLNTMLPILTKIVNKMAAFAETSVGKNLVKAVGVFGALLIPAGGFLIIMGSIGRIMLSMGGGMAAWGTAAKWVWTNLIRQALTYLGIMRGIQVTEKFNSAGRLINAATGRFVKRGAGGMMGRLGGGMVGRVLGRILPGMGRFGTSITGLLPLLGRLAMGLTGVGLVSMGLSMAGISLKRQFELLVGGITWVIASIINAAKSLIETVTFGAVSFDGNFRSRQNEINYTSFNDGPYTPQMAARDRNGSDNPQLESKYSAKSSAGGMYGAGNTNVHIYVDGEKTISKSIKQGQENELVSRFGLNQ